MFDDIRSVAGLRHAVVLTVAVSMLAACHGGPSDVVGGGGPSNANTSITLVAYSVPEPGWSKVIPAFNASQEGKGIQVISSYGASGDQSRGVADGKPADVVNFSVEPDITRLVKIGKVSKDWDKDATKGIPFGSVVTLVVRPGNPKNIKDWDDLLRPGVEVITPSPLSSGSAKWNLLAPYVVKSGGGHDSQAGLDFIHKLVDEHVKLRPGSGREATDVFVQGSGDVLISYENEAIAAERQGKPVTHVNPSQTIKIENPVAVVTSSTHLNAATAFKNFQYTAQAQTSMGGSRIPSGRSRRRRRGPGQVSGSGQTLDDRRSRWLGGRGQAAVRQELGQHHQDLHEGHRMTTAITREVAGGGNTLPHDRLRSDGTSLRVGVSILWLSVIVLLPLAAIAWQSIGGGWRAFELAVTSNAALESFRVTLTISAGVTVLNMFFGLLIAWVLVRDDFPGKRVVDAIIDLPFALPTIVASLVLLALYGKNSPVGLHLQHTAWGVGVALAFVTLPFVVRAVQPVLLEIDRETEEAAASLGANNATIFTAVVLPSLTPVLLTGAGLTFSRAIGEFGSVVLIGGAVPGKTEVSSQWIRTLIENDDRVGAAAISIVLLLISFVVLFVLRTVGSHAAKREELSA